jgi:hypothetical protein
MKKWNGQGSGEVSAPVSCFDKSQPAKRQAFPPQFSSLWILRKSLLCEKLGIRTSYGNAVRTNIS